LVGKNYSNKHIIEILERIERDGKKSHSLTRVGIGATLIAISIPFIILYSNMPLIGKWFAIILYFVLGSSLIFREYRNIKKE